MPPTGRPRGAENLLLKMQIRQVEDAAHIADTHGETALADMLYAFADVLLDRRRRLERGM